MKIDGSRCLVVAGARGLGREIALDLAAAGADVAVSFRGSAAPAAATATAIERLGRRAAAAAGDVATAAGAADVVCDAAAALGGLDALVFAAGAPFVAQPPHELDETTWDATLDTLAKGLFFCACAAHDVFVAGGRGGVVVALTDVLGLKRASAPFAAHTAAKAAQGALVRSLALAWADDAVRVCAVAPGPVALTDDRRPEATARAATRTAAGRAAQPDELCHAVRFCLENEFLTGAELVVDGGMSLM